MLGQAFQDQRLGFMVGIGDGGMVILGAHICARTVMAHHHPAGIGGNMGKRQKVGAEKRHRRQSLEYGFPSLFPGNQTGKNPRLTLVLYFAKYRNMNLVFKALSDPTRRQVLQLLRERPMTRRRTVGAFRHRQIHSFGPFRNPARGRPGRVRQGRHHHHLSAEAVGAGRCAAGLRPCRWASASRRRRSCANPLRGHDDPQGKHAFTLIWIPGRGHDGGGSCGGFRCCPTGRD